MHSIQNAAWKFENNIHKFARTQGKNPIETASPVPTNRIPETFSDRNRFLAGMSNSCIIRRQLNIHKKQPYAVLFAYLARLARSLMGDPPRHHMRIF